MDLSVNFSGGHAPLYHPDEVQLMFLFKSCHWFFTILPFMMCEALPLTYEDNQSYHIHNYHTVVTYSKCSCFLWLINQGVTLLALGNGAPDIFSVLAAITSSGKDTAPLAFQELFGMSFTCCSMLL